MILQQINRSIKSWPEKIGIERHLIDNKGKSVAAERSIRTLKNEFSKYMTLISKKVYIDKLFDIVNKYSHTYHKAIIMKPADVRPKMFIDFDKENNQEGPKLKVDDNVRISKYKNIFCKILRF